MRHSTGLQTLALLPAYSGSNPQQYTWSSEHCQGPKLCTETGTVPERVAQSYTQKHKREDLEEGVILKHRQWGWFIVRDTVPLGGGVYRFHVDIKLSILIFLLISFRKIADVWYFLFAYSFALGHTCQRSYLLLTLGSRITTGGRYSGDHKWCWGLNRVVNARQELWPRFYLYAYPHFLFFFVLGYLRFWRFIHLQAILKSPETY